MGEPKHATTACYLREGLISRMLTKRECLKSRMRTKRERLKSRRSTKGGGWGMGRKKGEQKGTIHGMGGKYIMISWGKGMFEICGMGCSEMHEIIPADGLHPS